MRTLVVAAQKGGTGKTLLAVNIAVCAAFRGKRVVVLDTDPQESTLRWYRHRVEHGIVGPKAFEVQACQGREVEARRRALVDTDLVVVDTPAGGSTDTAQALGLADLTVIPCRPSGSDLEGVGATVALVSKLGGKAVVVINCGAPRGHRNEYAAGIVRLWYQLEVCGAVIGDRKIFPDAFDGGESVLEAGPLSVAAAEIGKMYRWVSKRVG